MHLNNFSTRDDSKTRIYSEIEKFSLFKFQMGGQNEV